MAKSRTETHGVIRVGCAGWSLPKEYADLFPAEGTHLTRYAARFPAVEINSSFYHPHRPETYGRWAGSVPAGFRFSVKMPKLVTHERRLMNVDDVLDRFLAETAQLGDRLGPLLIQLPPSLQFSIEIAEKFFTNLRQRFDGELVLEPRHKTWFSPAPDRLLTQSRIARVAADPAVVAAAAEPGGWDGLVYYRLHGSPKMYYSTYADDYLRLLAEKLMRAAKSSDVWCIFDNTAEGAALVNALDVIALCASPAAV